MPITVCHISTVHVASDVRIFHRQCRSLVTAGYEVHLVIPADESSVMQGVHIHALRRVGNRLVRMLVMPWMALRAALRTRADIYHFHDPELLPMGFLLRWILRRRVIYDVHEAVAKQIMSKEWLPVRSRRIVSAAYKIVERLLSPGLVIVLANENCLADYPSSAYLVRNYPLIREPPAHDANRGGSDSTRPLLIYVGGVSHQRGGMVYVQLAHGLAQRGHDFRMMIIGPYSPAYGRQLASIVGKLKLQDHVTLTGRMDYDQAMDLAAQATIGLCLLLPVPNYTTILSTKIIEYMMLGTPVLASNFEVWRPYVEGEGAGMMADPCDIEEVVNVCEKMLSRPDELRAMGQRGMAAVRSRYNWSLEFKTLEACYRDVLAGTR